MDEHVHTLDLFDSLPAVVGQAPGGYRALALTELHRHCDDYDPHFVSWLKANWPVWTRFCTLADQVRLRRPNYSARALFHVIRLDTVLREQPLVAGGTVPAFKINNNYSAQCARLYNAMSPDREGFFFTREVSSCSV